MNRTLLTIWSALFFLMGLIACNPSAETDTSDSVPSETEFVEEETPLDCPDEIDLICEDGLASIPLGSFIADFDSTGLGISTIEDSVENGNGYLWISRTVNLQVGRIIVEGDFIDVRQSNDTLLSASRVNRIRVESPMFHTMEGIRVGQPISQLIATDPEAELQVDPIPNYRAFQVRKAGSHLFFLIGDPDGTVPASESGSYDISALPADAPIIGIVVM